MTSVKIKISKQIFKGKRAEHLSEIWNKKLKNGKLAFFKTEIDNGNWNTSFLTSNERSLWKKLKQESELWF